ncbi:NAD(P)-dependent oxidoreductase [Vibrio navarrensis]|uniref:NAD-dependent epimerase/dehydratase family protein n=1 Tax=Vibrio navarrensis TaxID=29495 RepID=A0AAJ4I9D1_9VIBR|nr:MULTISPECIES: NAD-dependent epimerase/dehydratase family protein [Vibrio]KJR21650.1 nucleoside-diphosphate sugar epimerase [Vibrio sp. S234-5]MBE3652257.1 NAD(P)-dependent oxidoreductase [Vibrio navarrensis]MBE3656737.1 NAD(P)-dependent oxidoreductase [Vibrio navarrensis]MBE3661706.1 NAD(P)-dependent oxidoreductase [Vibrio navarrensis]MBE4603053.1 NAD(P)-dependent oxidoreductase [Vibrio navarrensis]
MKNILIIGAGWLGFPLAQTLTTLGHTVFITRRSQEALESLDFAANRKWPLDLNHPDARQQLSHHLNTKKFDVVIGCFPPGFRKGQGDEYAQHWQLVVDALSSSPATKVIMISSTTVYPNRAEKMVEDAASLAIAQNNSQFSDKARIMLQAENALVQSGHPFTILRLSGLIGPQRHPARFVAHLKQVSRLAPANMLHQYDAVNAAVFAVTHADDQILNVTTPRTVDKATFYQSALEAAGMPEALPEIVDVADKEIRAEKLLSLGFKFHYQSTLDALSLTNESTKG